jgi:outer membrane protein assembly factor BamB
MRNDRTFLAILIGLAIAGLAGLVGCSAPGVSPVSPAPTSPAPASTAASQPGVGPTAALGGRDAWLVVGRKGAPDLEVILASTAEQDYALPNGIPDETWGHIFSTSTDGARTTLTHLVVQPGFGGPQTVIDGAWRLPTIGLDPTPVGVSSNASESPNGATVVLVEDVPVGTARTTSRFAVLRHTPTGEPVSRVIELHGSFDYDAISPDGSSLYVVEHLAGQAEGRYQVRAVDVATGSLRDAIIADKRNVGEAMAGWPIAQIRRSDGVVLTLYRGTEHPFIHALNTAEGWAVCIDLPASRDDASAALDWGLAAAPDGQAVFAVNATLGVAVDVNPTDLTVRRTASLQPPATGSVVLAKFGHGDVGPAGRRVVVAPDGHTIFAAGSTGILALDTARLTESRRLLEGTAVAGLGLTPDARTLYALEGSGGIVVLDATSGDVIGRVPVDGFDRLLAVVPW